MSKKLVSLDHLRMEAERSAGLASQVAAAAAEAIEELDNKKQNKLTGVAGEIVGFDASGNPVAQTAPDTGVTSFKGRTGAVTPKSGDYTAEQVGALPISGGTLTGDLTGKYIIGTWLKTTAAGHLNAAATKIPVLDSAGWLYYRTAQELVGDIGAATMTQVNAAIDTAITGAINASY